MASQNIHELMKYAHLGKALVEEAAQVVQDWETAADTVPPDDLAFDLKTARAILEQAQKVGVVPTPTRTIKCVS